MFSRMQGERKFPCQWVVCVRLLQPRWSSRKNLRSILNRRAGRSSGKLLDVFAQQIRLQIYGITWFALAQGGDFPGVWNNPNSKASLSHLRDGETDAVDGN